MFEQIALIFDELDFITANLTTVIMLLTLFSLLLANIARYAQAKLYGIPLKMVHQASIPDSLDIWITLVCVLGFGLVQNPPSDGKKRTKRAKPFVILI